MLPELDASAPPAAGQRVLDAPPARLDYARD